MKNKIRSLPLCLEDVAGRNKWRLLDYESNGPLLSVLDVHGHSKHGDGFTCIFQKYIIIFYKQKNAVTRQRFTIAHEMGHIVLQHLTNLSTRDYEQEANMFAIRILSPMCVLKECACSSAKEVASLCNISPAAAIYRFERLRLLFARDKFYTSKLEVKVLNNFKRFISKYKNKTK